MIVFSASLGHYFFCVVSNQIVVSRGSVNSHEVFCYVCGKFVVKKKEWNTTDFVKKAYYAYFGAKLGDQDKQ